MADTRQRYPKIAYDFLIVGAGIALVLLISAAGVQVGHPLQKGAATVLGGVYVIYLSLLFLLSYVLSDASYVLSFLRHFCEKCTRGARGRQMAFVFFGLGLVFGIWILLVGLGTF